MGQQQYGSDKGYVEYITRIEEDTVTANTFYIGHARPRTTTATAAWRIKRIIVTGAGGAGPGDTSVSIAWALGDDRFAHTWDGRQGLSYT